MPHYRISLRMLRLTRAASLLCVMALMPVVHGYERVTGRDFASRSEVYATQGMVATSQPLATQAGLRVLEEGGNAIDAAIAANAVLGVVEPTGCGIGGDLFAIVWDAKTKKLHGLNASGPAGSLASIEKVRAAGLSKIPAHGGMSVSVPGAVAGWEALHERFGSVPFAQLMAPAEKYASEGFPVSELIAYYLGRSARVFADYPEFKKVWMQRGATPARGEVFKNPALAKTMALIGAKGADGFYKGKLARAMVKTIQDDGGFVTLEDLASFEPEWVDPVSTNYRGYDVWELPPNGQGIAALQILNILEGYDLAEMGEFSTDYAHVFVEAKKLAFGDRARLYADMRSFDVPLKRLLSKEYAARQRARIDMARAARTDVALAEKEAGLKRGDRSDTIYLAVADKHGNMVSLIQSNYRGMGSGLMPKGTGFMLQDRGELFSLDPKHPNALAPGKRPFHTIIPAFVTKDGAPWLAFGVMGGATQPQMHAQILINMIDFGMGLQEAGDAARMVHTGSSQPTGEEMTNGGELHLERGFSQEVQRDLARRGHKITRSTGVFGGYQAVMRLDTGVLVGASESRKDGHAAGF